jgi:hypothetical protein
MKQNNVEIEKYRIRSPHPLGSDESYGNNGAFIVPGPRGIKLGVIASNGASWEHVSVHRVDKHNCPFWDEMCFIKSLFWEPEEAVMQLHPPESHYVNNHPTTLHLWKPIGVDIPLPPEILVGIKSLGTFTGA